MLSRLPLIFALAFLARLAVASTLPVFRVRMYMSDTQQNGAFQMQDKDRFCSPAPGNCANQWALVAAPGYCLLDNRGTPYSPAFSAQSPVFGVGIYQGNTLGTWGDLWGAKTWGSIGLQHQRIWTGADGFTCQTPETATCNSWTAFINQEGSSGLLEDGLDNWWAAYTVPCYLPSRILCACLENSPDQVRTTWTAAPTQNPNLTAVLGTSPPSSVKQVKTPSATGAASWSAGALAVSWIALLLFV